jgi:epoxyqueuosine reductase
MTSYKQKAIEPPLIQDRSFETSWRAGLLCKGLACDAGFVAPRILNPFNPKEKSRNPAPSLLTVALPYGNQQERIEPPPDSVVIAPFARRNYYREAVKRLQKIASVLRTDYGGTKADYQILCNSPIPEKPLAAGSGTGSLGRNGLIITAEAGSLVILAAMTLPFAPDSDPPSTSFALCSACKPPFPCAASCPTGALAGDGTLKLNKCIQWYASGYGESVPDEVLRFWGKRLYGCTNCQEACIHNRKAIQGVDTSEGVLPAYFNAQELLALSNDALRALFKGTALGGAWLKPEALRRNILCAGFYSASSGGN